MTKKIDNEVDTFSPEFESLSVKHQKFVLEYLKNDHNAGKAYKAIYPKCSAATAETNGPRLLRKAQIKDAIRAEMDQMLSSDKLQIERLIYKNITEVLQAETGHYIDDNGDVNIEALKKRNPGAIRSYEKKITVGKHGESIYIKYTMESKASAREHGAKLLGLIKGNESADLDLTGATVNIKISTNPNQGGGDAD